MSENIQTIEQKLDAAVKQAPIPEGKTPLEFHSHAAQVSTDAARILDKAAELIIADGGDNAGDRAAELLGFSLDG